MLKKIDARGPVAVCGGVAGIDALIEILEDKLKSTVILLKNDKQIIPAYGAALIAAERI